MDRLKPTRERVIAAGAGLILPWIDAHLALAHAALGDTRSARAMLEDSISRSSDFGWVHGLAHSYLGYLALNDGDHSGADAHGRDALAIGHRVGTPIVTAFAHEILGRSAAQRGAWKRSDELLREALATRITHELWLQVPQTLDALAETLAGLARREDAAATLGLAERARADLALACWTPAHARAVQVEQALRRALGERVFDRAFRRYLEDPLVDTATRLCADRGYDGQDKSRTY